MWEGGIVAEQAIVRGNTKWGKKGLRGKELWEEILNCEKRLWQYMELWEARIMFEQEIVEGNDILEERPWQNMESREERIMSEKEL